MLLDDPLSVEINERSQELTVAAHRELPGILDHVPVDRYIEAMDRIGEVVSAETGKNRGDALAEVTAALTAMDLYSRQAAKLLRTKKGKAWPFQTIKGWPEYHPRGVAGVIQPAVCLAGRKFARWVSTDCCHVQDASGRAPGHGASGLYGWPRLRVRFH